MKIRLIIALLALCFITAAHARIGESEAQIETRYGKPKDTSKQEKDATDKLYKGVLFNFADMAVFVMINRETGLSELEVFEKLNSEPFSDHELDLILNANAKQWEYGGISSQGKKEWKSADGSIFAICAIPKKQLTLMSKAMGDHLNSQKKATEEKKLQGL